jgi:hypothetical protein
MISYSTTHRVEIKVPNVVWERFGHTKEFERFSCDTACVVAAAGRDQHAEVIEWGESSDLAECKAFADLWAAQIQKWMVSDAHQFLADEARRDQEEAEWRRHINGE